MLVTLHAITNLYACFTEDGYNPNWLQFAPLDSDYSDFKDFGYSFR